jgi:uncharacterized membrane protein YgcG
MNNYFKYFITSSVIILMVVAFILLAIMDTRAQGNKPAMQKAPASVNVDGHIKEWGDSLAFYNDKTRLNYTIANNDTDLYVVIFSSDRQTIHKILAGGITVAINPDGKKNKKYSLTYPLPDKASAFPPHSNTGDGGDQNQQPSLLQSTGIKAEGFKGLESDVMTTANTYGFKAAVKLDDKHNLGYEIGIPLKFLNLKPGKNTNVAINISVNGIERPTPRRESNEGIGGSGRMSGGGFGGGGGRMGGGRNGRTGGQAPQSPSELSKSEDFWINVTMPAY